MLCDKYFVAELYVFGSVLTENFNPESDIDFLVRFSDITPEAGGKDVFAHYSEIKTGNGFKSLQENQRVEFEVRQGAKGLQAANIRAI